MHPYSYSAVNKSLLECFSVMRGVVSEDSFCHSRSDGGSNARGFVKLCYVNVVSSLHLDS